MYTGRLFPVSLAALSGVFPVAAAAHAPRVAPLTTVVGAFPAPTTGSGPGTLAQLSLPRGSTQVGHYGTANTSSGNSFYVGYSAITHSIYTPTVAGITYVSNSSSLQATGSFTSIPGGRIARVVPNNNVLLVLASNAVAGYTLNSHRSLFTDAIGGNAVVLNPDGRVAFVGGNADSVITAIDVRDGKVLRTYDVPQIGDMVWAHGQIFAADIKTGVMTVLNPATGGTVTIPTPEVDPTFSCNDIPAATAGFMQLAVGSHQGTVYAAGFSGHILEFSATRDRYLGEIPVNANTNNAGANQLSGLAILPGGTDALVTVENLRESVIVNLASGVIQRVFPSFASNRWILVPTSKR
ncbi:YncE family protein [Ferrimicrobium sp.]|uniref:YncE family protein n=1 Tax=Ferrimicrobium sp. TaxID=2926050 RepID=UPI002631D407|nr:hypothetical protein [Ferrimicrobium sp.]